MAGHVLLVDDFDDAREMYAEFLRAAGHRVTEAADGHEALERAERETYDLIILDIALPRVDGISVIRALRKRERNRRTPIITLSASVNEETRHEALEAGANLALDKPCLPDELAQAVSKMLRKQERTG